MKHGYWDVVQVQSHNRQYRQLCSGRIQLGIAAVGNRLVGILTRIARITLDAATIGGNSRKPIARVTAQRTDLEMSAVRDRAAPQ